MLMTYGQHVCDVLAARPQQLDTFQAAMTSSSAMDGKAITGAYDFSGIKRLADVGGGHCALLASILQAYCSIGQRSLTACRRTGSPAAKDALASGAAAFFERLPVAGTPT
jgi:hypothetical protein